MQDLSGPMQAALAPRTSAASLSRNRTLLFEIYLQDTFPDVDGIFDPSLAIARWAKTELTWLGNLYQRRIVSHSAINKYISGQFDSFTLTIENTTRFFSQFLATNDVQGMRAVVRYINIDLSAALADSVVEAVGRVQAPEGSDVDREQGDLTIKEELASLDIEIPKRRVSPDDPQGRSPNDPLYEGITLNARPSMVKFVETTMARKFFFLLKKKETIKYNQWSSESGSADAIIPLIGGRVQLEGLPIFSVDIGFYIIGIWAFAAEAISSITNFLLPDSNYIFFGWWADEAHRQTHVHLGDPGGTGTNATPDTIENNYPQNTALLSRLAYCAFAIGGPETVSQPFANPQMDATPTLIGIVRGKMQLPDGAGVFNQIGFSDSVPYYARHVLTSQDYFGLDPRLVYDGELPAVHAERQRPIVDKSNGELLYLTGYDAKALIDGNISRFNSTSLLSPAYYKNIASGGADPLVTSRTDAVPILLDPGICDPLTERWNPITQTCDPIEPVVPIVPAVSHLRRAYTFNAPLTDTVNASDFLNNVVLPTGRLYKLTDSAGRIRIRARKASDSSFMVSNAAIGATFVLIANVEPWANLKGYVLINVGLTTSEYRRVTSATYDPTTGNAMTLAVSGTGLAASGATLSGGSTSVPSSGTVAVNSLASPGTVLTVTVWGIPITYTVSSADDVKSIAGILCASINADPNLRQYVRAVWDSAHTITMYSTVGKLNFADALVNAHLAQLASPLVAPTASATGSGTLTPGDYYLGYTDIDGSGDETVMSPLRKITITSGQKVSVSSAALPAGVAERNWYFSPAVGDDHVQYYSTNTGGAFTINAVADHDADDPPEMNTTGGETIRVAEVFNQYNIRAGSFKWSPSKSKINQVSGTFVNAVDGFKRTPITVNDRAHQRAIRQVNKKDINLSGVDNFSQASRLCYATLAEERDAGTRWKWSTDDAGIPLEIGDVVAVNGQYVDSAGVVQKEFVNQPVMIEETSLAEDFDVSFVGVVYSTSLLEGQTGRRPIVISSTLKYFTEPPPVATNVVIELDDAFLTGFIGDFDFGSTASTQSGLIFIKGPAESEPSDSEYKLLDVVLPDATNHGHFEVRAATAGKFWIKIVTQSQFGQSASSGHPVTIVDIRPAAPTDELAVADGSRDFHISLTGHPRSVERPETYIARVRRFSDGVLMRDLPMIPDISMAAMFEGSGNVDIQKNNLYPTGDPSEGFSRSIQTITSTGSYLDCVVSIENFSLNATLHFIPSTLSPWNNLFGSVAGIVIQSGDLTHDPLWIVTGFAGETLFSGRLKSPAKLRIAFVGTEVRFYVDWTGPSTRPFAVSAAPPSFPVKLRAHVQTGAKVENIIFGGLSQPQTIYSLRQRTFDNEANGGTGPVDDITLETWQVSPIAEIGFKGFSSPVTRFTL